MRCHSFSVLLTVGRKMQPINKKPKPRWIRIGHCFFFSGSIKLYKFLTETYLGVFGDAKLVSDCYYTFISTKQTINYSVIIKSIHCTFFNRFFGGIRSTSARSRAAHSWLAFQKHPVHTRIKGRHRCPETTLNQTHRGNKPVSFARDIRQYSCVCF